METAVIKYLNGEGRVTEIAAWLGVDRNTVYRWVRKYRATGSKGLEYEAGKRYIEKNPIYPKALKEAAVLAYRGGEGSQAEICKKFGIRSRHALENWLKVYNSGKDFRHKMSGGSGMKTGSKVNQEERIQITKDCLENGSNYGETAQKYNVSYQQVYTWVKKFKAQGEAGLEGRRGKRTAEQTARTPEEELKIRVAQLEHELYMTKMERDLLKKLEEKERRDAFHK